MEIRFIHTIRQKVWGWPVVANFILGEAAGGFYIRNSERCLSLISPSRDGLPWVPLPEDQI
jgi:hypothetical protein